MGRIDFGCFGFGLQFITLGLCLMELNSIRAVTGARPSSSPLAKVSVGLVEEIPRSF